MGITFFCINGWLNGHNYVETRAYKRKTPLSRDSGVSESGRLPGPGFRVNYDTVMMPLFR
jgi:hypothetical protein